jgi:hypothetical protein
LHSGAAEVTKRRLLLCRRLLLRVPYDHAILPEGSVGQSGASSGLAHGHGGSARQSSTAARRSGRCGLQLD